MLLVVVILIGGCLGAAETGDSKTAGYAPLIEPSDFVSDITNRYFTAVPGNNFVYESDTEDGLERIEVYVTNETRVVMGVTARVVWDRVWLDGELIEDTKDWYAQDAEGNVWYFGEDSKELEDGSVVNTEGSWEAGVDDAQPGIIMKADPRVGDSYRQEYYAGVAEDMGEVLALDETVTMRSGTFAGCLKTRDWTPLETGSDTHKYYCPDAGWVVLEVALEDGQRTELVDITEGASATEELSSEQLYWNERIDAAFEPVDCPAPRDPNGLPDGYYKGPMFDTHMHIASLPDGGPGDELDAGDVPTLGVNMGMDTIVCALDVEGTEKAIGFFPVWEPIIEQQVEVVRKTTEEYPDRFILFIMPPDDDGSPDGYPTVDAETLEEMLDVEPGLFEGYGEIGLYARQGGAAALPPDSQRLMEIYPVVREHGLVVYFHLGEGQQEAYENVLSANPDITFIFHGDQLIPYENGVQNLEHIEEILDNHPNVYYGVDELYGDEFLMRPEVSKEEFLAHFADYEPLLEKDLGTWKGFTERHPNQVLWDTDRGWSSPWSLDPEVALTLNNYTRAFIGRLNPAVQEKYAYENAQRIFKG